MKSDASASKFPEGNRAVVHRDDEYDPRGFALLWDMQERHFWYRGRHRFLLRSVTQHLPKAAVPRVVDLGGGCGGWISYLAARKKFPTAELALADSAPEALRLAAAVLPRGTETFQVDLLDLPWTDRWDVAFLLDVLEHIPAHEEALRQVHRAGARRSLVCHNSRAASVLVMERRGRSSRAPLFEGRFSAPGGRMRVSTS